MASINLSQYTSLYQYVYATVSWNESPTVTVVITGNAAGLSWRIRGRGSDTEVYLSDASGAVGVERTFDAPDGVRDFAFQVYSTIGGNDQNGSYTNGATFTVEFTDDESDSGSDSGDDDDDSGGSSSGYGSSTLHINQGEGTVVTVERTWSDYGDYTHDGNQVFMSDGDTVYYDADRFTITVEAEDGYRLDYYDFNGTQVPFQLSNFSTSSSGRYKLTYNRDATITTTATRISGSDEDDTGSSGSTSTGFIVVDGKMLPGIPSDALSIYLYAVVLRGTGSDSSSGTSYILLVSDREFVHANDSTLIEDFTEVMVSPGAGAGYLCGNLGDNISLGFDAWVFVTSYEAGSIKWPVGTASSDGSTSTLVYANHDVYDASDYDVDAGTYTKGELYFASSTGESGDDSGDGSGDGSGTETTHDYYLFKRSTIVGFANQARRLGGVTGELSPARMQKIFESVSTSSGSGSGDIPDAVGVEF